MDSSSSSSVFPVFLWFAWYCMVLCGIASYSMVLQGPFVFFRYFSLCLYHCLLVGQASLFITRINCGHSLVSGRLGLFVLPNLLAMINDKMIKPINNYCGRMGKGGTSNAHDYCSVLGQLSTSSGPGATMVPAVGCWSPTSLSSHQLWTQHCLWPMHCPPAMHPG